LRAALETPDLGISLLSSLGGAGQHRSLLLICALGSLAPRQACVGRRWRVGRAARAENRIAACQRRQAARPGALVAAGNASRGAGRRKPRRHRRSTPVVENIHHKRFLLQVKDCCTRGIGAVELDTAKEKANPRLHLAAERRRMLDGQATAYARGPAGKANHSTCSKAGVNDRSAISPAIGSHWCDAGCLQLVR
jgi:hypothetical protein